MHVEVIAAKITALLEEVHADGVKIGRDLEYQEGIQTMIAALEKRRDTKPRQRTRAARESTPTPPAPPAAEPAPPADNGIRARVEEALTELASDHTDGVYPDDLATATQVKVSEVRAALRHMTLTGTARRMARGKYLPATPLLNLQTAAQ